MEDKSIIELYESRDESAIVHTQQKYGRYCHFIAYNILGSEEDAEECVNDTYLKVWNAIPPAKPDRLSVFIGKIARNTAIDRYLYIRAEKRNSSFDLTLDELGECVSDSTSLNISDELALKEAINSFLASLPQRTRVIFMRRYFYMCSVKDIACSLDLSQSNVKVILSRTRERFKSHLEKEGILI